jgi:hypothetical protein
MFTNSSGWTVRPSSLGTKPKRIFDPGKKEDLLEYRYFITKGRWKSKICPFQLLWPYLDIPSMLHEMVAKHYVTKELK